MSQREQPLVVGLVGGIGSGKSSVARCLSDHRRIEIIDADRIGHELLGNPAVTAQLRRTFGDSVFDGQEIDRHVLASRVFGPLPHHKSSLEKLEEIVHPEIRQQIEVRIHNAASNLDTIILDAAVMFEADWDDLCDQVVFIDVPFEARLERVQTSRGWSEDELLRRESSQMSLDEKRKSAGFSIDNSTSTAAAAAAEQLDRLIEQFLMDSR